MRPSVNFSARSHRPGPTAVPGQTFAEQTCRGAGRYGLIRSGRDHQTEEESEAAFRLESVQPMQIGDLQPERSGRSLLCAGKPRW